MLDSPNGSMKRDAWTDSFGDIIFALDFPESFTPPTDTTPTTPGAVVRIPDPNLRAAVAEELGKSANAPITIAEMEQLTSLDVRLNGNIKDLTGLQFAKNLRSLILGEHWGKGNQVSDLSPIANLISLRRLDLNSNPISDLTLISGLTNLTKLKLILMPVRDLSPIRNLTNLTYLAINGSYVTDLSPMTGLTNLKEFSFGAGRDGHRISDISPLTGLTNLEEVSSWGHEVSDLSPLAGLTNLKKIDFCGGNISDLTPLTGLTGLEHLYIFNEKVSDISPLAELTGLTRLNLEGNDISDISALAGLTNLKWLSVAQNQIADLSPLDGLRENITLLYHSNPAFPEGGPKIEGPWLWVVLPDTVDDHLNDTDFLSEASGGTVTEVEIATHGATAGKSIGDSVWTSYRLPSTGQDNILGYAGTAKSVSELVYGSVFSLFATGAGNNDVCRWRSWGEGLAEWVFGL